MQKTDADDDDEAEELDGNAPPKALKVPHPTRLLNEDPRDKLWVCDHACVVLFPFRLVANFGRALRLHML